MKRILQLSGLILALQTLAFHFAMAGPKPAPLPTVITQGFTFTIEINCPSVSIDFVNHDVTPAITNSGLPVDWKIDFGEGPIVSGTGANWGSNGQGYTYSVAGDHYVSVTLTLSATDTILVNNVQYAGAGDHVVLGPVHVKCGDCLPQFSPFPGGQYVVQAWAKQANGQLLTDYWAPNITLDFDGASSGTLGPFFPSGPIIEGWQRIETEITIPIGADSIEVNLNNAGTENVYFDDIRIFPFDGNMVSYVYDPVTMRVVADLDANNYATFYVYDEEGNLLKKKRETERGIKTLEEGRSGARVTNPFTP